VAEAGAATARAEASDSVFTLVTTRLEAVEKELDRMREQLRERDRTIAEMRMHILTLEHTLRLNNIDVPQHK
jgi:hypothetical protein